MHIDCIDRYRFVAEGNIVILLENVSKKYGDNIGLYDASIRINDGEFVFLVGPSGSGKSTFIKLILKEIEPDEGNIFMNGYDVGALSNRTVPKYRRDIGIVFQDFRLLPKKTVYENVAFAMEAVHQKRKLIKKQVPHILNLVGISEKADKYPNELSGGEAQRVAIARAMVNNPKVLIADEPTGNLDPEKSWEIMNLLNQINLRGTTIVMVTHAREIVDRMNKRVIQIENGRIVRDDESGNYIDDQTKDITKTQILQIQAMTAQARSKRNPKSNRKNSDNHKKSLSTEELIQQVAELEQQKSDRGGDLFD